MMMMPNKRTHDLSAANDDSREGTHTYSRYNIGTISMIDNVSMAVTLGVTARDDTEDIGHTRVYGHSQAGPAKDISDNYLCSSPREIGGRRERPIAQYTQHHLPDWQLRSGNSERRLHPVSFSHLVGFFSDDSI